MKKQVRGATVKKNRDLWPFHLAVLAILTIIAYANSLNGRFIFDDQQIVMQNPRLMNIRTFGDVIVLGTGWRQLLFVTYGFNFYLSGMNTYGYHVVNLFLHVVNVMLVYAIIRAVMRVGGPAQKPFKEAAVGGVPTAAGPVGPTLKKDQAHKEFIAIAGASVFSVHTLLSSAVSYIAGRSSVLCATFYFAAILFFLKALAEPRKPVKVALLGLTGLAGLLAFQTKQEAITLPLFLAGVFILRTEKKDVRWIAPLAAAPAVIVLLMRDEIAKLYQAVYENQVLVSAGFERVLLPATYFRTYLTSVIGYYFPRFIFPIDLSADPHILPVENWYSPEFLVSLVMFAALTWLALRFYKREPLLSLGIMALLVSPLMAYAAIPLADVVLEHRAYIPGLGMAFIFAWAFHWVADNYSSLRWPALGVLVVVFTVMTVNRNPVFANNIALWEDAERKGPQKPRPHFNLGQAYQEGQRLNDAIREYEHALALKPDIHAAYSNIAAIYLDQKQLARGEEMLLKVTQLAPQFTEGFINLGVLYIRLQQPDKAIAAIDRAIKLNGESFAAHFNKGEALTQKGDFKAALESYKQAVQLRPDLETFRLTLGVAYNRAGDRGSAEKEFLKLTGGSLSAEAYRNLGGLFNEAGQPDKAVSYYQRAVQVRPAYPDALHDLGILYLKQQKPNEAIPYLTTTLRHQPDHGPAVLNLAMAYQMKGDVPTAKQTLQAYVEKYRNSGSPYVATAQQRLGLFK